MYKPVNLSLILLSLVLLLVELTSCTSVPPSDATDTQTTPPVPIAVPPSQPGKLKPSSPPRPPDRSGYVARGRASWYGLSAHGAKTASGQIYDLYGLTAAHASLPLLTRVKVKNLRTGRSVVVTINDRLHDKSRVLIKLSYWAARHIGLVKNLSQPVEVRGLSSQIPRYISYQ